MEHVRTDDSDKEQKKQFKVCFAYNNLIGRSNIQIGKPLSISIKYYNKLVYHN